MKKICRIMLMVSLLIGVFIINTSASTPNLGVTYSAHVQTIDWQTWKFDGELAGTQGQALRVEALKVKLTGAPTGASIKYKTYVQSLGWQEPVIDGEISGTQGRALRVEAIKISLLNLPDYSVVYRAHVQQVGWQPWVSDDAEAGTEARALRVEAVEARIVIKQTSVSLNKTIDDLIVGQTDNLQATSLPTNIVNQDIAWTSTNDNVIQVDSTGKITAKSAGAATVTATTLAGNKVASCSITVKPLAVTSVALNKAEDNLQVGKTDTLIGTVAPTNATNKAIDWKSSDTSIAQVDAYGKVTGIKVGTATITATTLDGSKTANCVVSISGSTISDVSVSYQAYLQRLSWQGTAQDGSDAGKAGQGLRVEAMKISLLNAPTAANITYQAYVEGQGWQSVKSNGQVAGTQNQALRIEALKISLQNLPGYGVSYRAYVQNVGWQPWVMDGNIAGTQDRTLRIEAVDIRIVKTISAQYQIKVQNTAWGSLASSGIIAGTNGLPLKIEALKIKLVNAPVGVSLRYQTQLQHIGWQGWTDEGQTAGADSQALGIEAIKIEVINAPGYSVQYQVEVEKVGWQPWTSNGQIAGTVGKGLGIKGIRIRVVSNADVSTVLPVVQSAVVDTNSFAYKLSSYLNSTANIQSVEATAVALHSGDTSNNCVYFSSEAMRRVGIGVPTSMANTKNYVPYLASIGLAKQFNLNLLALGDICFSVTANTGYPTHTYVFMDWVNPDDHSLAYVADNQGSTIHIRSMIQTAVYDAFAFFFN